jgi:hypothetical protein
VGTSHRNPARIQTYIILGFPAIKFAFIQIKCEPLILDDGTKVPASLKANQPGCNGKLA